MVRTVHVGVVTGGDTIWPNNCQNGLKTRLKVDFYKKKNLALAQRGPGGEAENIRASRVNSYKHRMFQRGGGHKSYRFTRKITEK